MLALLFDVWVVVLASVAIATLPKWSLAGRDIAMCSM